MKFLIPRCSFALGLLVLVSVSVTGSSAGNSSPHNGNFRVVLDSPPGHDKKTRLMLKNKIQSSVADVDLRAMVDRAKMEFKTISAKTKQIGEEAREIVDKFKDNLQHYSRRELGIYAALTVALTVTLKNVVFAKSSSKTIDLGKINYILASASAIVAMQKLAPILEFKRKKGIANSLDLALTPSIVSSDGKTYIRTVKKSLKQKSYSTSASVSAQARPAQVVIDTVAAFYPETEPVVTRSLPASHNAVINTMSPSMRRSLKAHRIRVRGGAAAGGLMEKLEIGGYFAAWYALNVVYNIINKKVLNVLPAPLIVGTIQFGIGALYCVLVWLLKFRPCPKLTKSGTKAVASVVKMFKSVAIVALTAASASAFAPSQFGVRTVTSLNQVFQYGKYDDKLWDNDAKKAVYAAWDPNAPRTVDNFNPFETFEGNSPDASGMFPGEMRYKDPTRGDVSFAKMMEERAEADERAANPKAGDAPGCAGCKN